MEKLTTGKYSLSKFSGQEPKTPFSAHLEALNYLMYEWCQDHGDKRYEELFDYILVPEDCDFDFTSITFGEFFKFLVEKKI
jgi:hypothetical protein